MTVDVILSFFHGNICSSRPIINDINFKKKNFLLIKLMINDISNTKAWYLKIIFLNFIPLNIAFFYFYLCFEIKEWIKMKFQCY